MIYLVSRHIGGSEFLQSLFPQGIVVKHLDLAILKSDDIVIGNLPIDLVAEICARGIEFRSLVIPQIGSARIIEYNAQELSERGARVVRYYAKEVPDANLGPSLHAVLD